MCALVKSLFLLCMLTSLKLIALDKGGVERGVAKCV
jgi:hypothetical protein